VQIEERDDRKKIYTIRGMGGRGTEKEGFKGSTDLPNWDDSQNRESQNHPERENNLQILKLGALT